MALEPEDYLELFLQEEKKHTEPQENSTKTGFWLLLLWSLCYLCSFELAGVIALFVDTGALVFPKSPKIGMLGGEMDVVFFVVVLHVWRLFLLMKTSLERGEPLDHKLYVFYGIVLFLGQFILTLIHLAHRLQPLTGLSTTGLALFEKLILAMGFPYFAFVAYGIAQTIWTKRPYVDARVFATPRGNQWIYLLFVLGFGRLLGVVCLDLLVHLLVRLGQLLGGALG